jgi:glycogen debranching enzyme
MKISSLLVLLLFSNILFSQVKKFNLKEATQNLPHILGKQQNSEYLYVTAGNRLYCIGNQAGKFPEVGFHIPGKMGGIWQHPVKLMDGFSLSLKKSNTSFFYPTVCDSFVSYSLATRFHYSIPNENISIAQTQFVPDNLPVMVVEYEILNSSSQSRSFDLELNTDIDLMPVWLAEKSGWIDHQDTLVSLDKNHNILCFRDKGNNWFAGIGFENNQVQFKELKKTNYKGNGITGVSTLQCFIPGGKKFTFRFYISGSLSGVGEIEKNISYAKFHLFSLFNNKKERYNAIEKTAEIRIPDKLLETAYNWGKYTTDWLMRDVPGMGQGLSAGLPDYPWFFSNDQATTFMALTGMHDPRLFYHSFSMLKRISDQVNADSGRIIHEVSTNGVVYDKGRMEESQLHIIAAWQIFKWTGNLQFLKENYEFAKRTWNWLQQHDTNNNGYIEGAGGVEIAGLNDELLDVQINTFEFLKILSQMAAIFKDLEDSEKYNQKAEALKAQINSDWWVDSENRYADFISSKEKALEIIDDALAKRVKNGRNNWAAVKLNHLKEEIRKNSWPYKGYVVYYNASGLQPMENGIADSARSLQMLKHAAFFTNKFGLYIAGIERPDDVRIDEGKFRKDSAFSYNGAVMPVASTVLAETAARFGLADTALMYIHKTLNSFSYATPGTVYEISPDYGMFVQAWNVTGVNIPLIQYFFGVQPDAFHKEITIYIRMPAAWNNASLKNLLIGTSRFSIQYLKKNNSLSCFIESSEPGWKIHFVTDTKAGNFIVNNKPWVPSNRIIELKGIRNVVEFTFK